VRTQPQATRASREQIALHNHHRTTLREQMVRNLDAPRPIELATVAVVLIIAAVKLYFITH